VQALHDCGPVAFDHAGQFANGFVDAGIQCVLLGAGRSPQHKAGHLRTVAGMADTQTQAVKCVVVAQFGDDVAQTVVPAVPATFLALDHARRQIQLVVGNQDFFRCNAIETR